MVFIGKMQKPLKYIMKKTGKNYDKSLLDELVSNLTRVIINQRGKKNNCLLIKP